MDYNYPSPTLTVELVVQEVLAKPGYETLSLAEQEFYELRLDDLDDLGRRRFFVKQAHIQWSEIDQQMMWDIPPAESFPTLAQAEARYESRRKALVKMGFSQSDMDF